MLNNILVVEDDPNLGQILLEYLQAKGYNAQLARDGQKGWQAYQSGNFALCLLDVMLPQMDGFELGEKIRNSNKHIPIIFLTAKSLKEDTIKGLRLGADDYLTKPFSLEELLLRIEAILRRTTTQTAESRLVTSAQPVQIGQYTLYPQSQELYYKGAKAAALTAKESQLLYMLGQHKGQLLNRTEALKTIWHDDSYFNARSMDVYITKLRKRLKNDASLQIISVRGEGFKLVQLLDII